MRDFVRWLSKALLTGVVWVFILSIDIKDQMVFFWAHDLFVQNSLVQAVDRQIDQAWDELKDMARIALRDKEDVKSENL